MKPRITVITLGVQDLPASVRFYRDGLGLRTEGIVGEEFAHGAVAFFEMQPGLKLALWPRESIAHDTINHPHSPEFPMRCSARKVGLPLEGIPVHYGSKADFRSGKRSCAGNAHWLECV